MLLLPAPLSSTTPMTVTAQNLRLPAAFQLARGSHFLSVPPQAALVLWIGLDAHAGGDKSCGGIHGHGVGGRRALCPSSADVFSPLPNCAHRDRCMRCRRVLADNATRWCRTSFQAALGWSSAFGWYVCENGDDERQRSR
ncbi:hypothetical protein FB45DRAFT_351 [Roridomyces roridus]|uniref:Uncharacterized protein n=1 Tax=Roridomyces roridus TaxID=1738132 RepID=A0AAD7CHT9_9AGAR|nr:hypothetical protein FB45DRAFT_351 [Roridomyces roridus]